MEVKTIYEFESTSDSKIIRKLIEFSLFDREPQVYNVALVDILADGTVSDQTVSNNSDMPKVLSTVFKAIYVFLKQNTYANVLIKGSTLSRTRLYQMAINKFLTELEQNFMILGYGGSSFKNFEKGKSYESFIVSLKN